MDSPLKKFLVFDLETGGLSYKTNSITEIAGVVVDSESLQIIEEFSVMLRPYLDLRSVLEESNKEAKRLFNELAVPGEEGRVKSLLYKDREVTLKSLEILMTDIDSFNQYLEEQKVKSRLFTYEQYLELKETVHSDIVEIYFNSCYNPQALEVTHITIEQLLKEGIEPQEACNRFKNLITSHTVGTYKPIISGHNIKGFDLPYIDKLFTDSGYEFYKLVNTFIIDTLEWVRLRWSSLSSFSLGVCANELGLTLKEAHRALPDTIANAKLLIELLKSMRNENGGQATVYVRRKLDFNY